MAKETPLSSESLGGLKLMKVESKAPYLNILIYGNSGIGKTVLAGSADSVASMRSVLVVDIEGGTESLRNTYPGCDVVRVTNWKEMQAVYDELHRGGHRFQTVILDSLTEIQKFSMYNIMEDLVKLKPDVDPDIPGMREWGKNIEQVRKFVRAFRDLPMHTIFTALAKDERNTRTGVVKQMPYLSGKLAGEVAAFLDIVGYYYVKDINVNGEMRFTRLLLTSQTEEIVAKDRTGSLPQVIEEPTMAKILEYTTSTQQTA